jgi:hypothetical protein
VSAEFGRFSGGLVNVITSRGNLFSGSFRESILNDDWRHWSRQRELRAAGGGRDDADVQYRAVFERGAVCRSALLRQRQGRQNSADARIHHRRADPEGSAGFFTAGRFQNQVTARNTIQPVNPPPSEDQRKRFEVN